jgi:hypothetical protein
MRDALDASEAGPAPNLDTVAEALGPITLPDPATAEAGGRERRRRRG